MGKRGHGEGNIRKRADGKWEARVEIGKTPEGKPDRKSFYGKTQKEAKEKMNDFIYNTNKGTLLEPTVSEWLDCWLTQYKNC